MEEISNNQFEFFITTAGFALALAGFSSIITTLRNSDTRLSSQELAGLAFVFEVSLCVSFNSLLVIAMSAASFSTIIMTKVVSIILSLTIFAILATQIVRITKLHLKKTPPRMEGPLKCLLLPLLFVAAIIAPIAAFCTLNNSIGLIAAMFILLFVAGAQFFVFLWKSSPSNN